ncbi:MAG TPA: hypothetical protein VNN79_03350 [Actinomycetota bacterium]|nr:hypothetical protein [Actinomycetota bacterium]
MRAEANRLRVLDFDIETRLIGFHKGGRFAPDGCEPIAIAWSWCNPHAVTAHVGPSKRMLREFAKAYAEADMVTGHYIRKFDLLVLNGAMIENGLPLLRQKLTLDTKGDLVAFAGLSKSQENLSEMLELAEAKYHMSDVKWREAARLKKNGRDETIRRVVDDVVQHMELREALTTEGLLRGPRVWAP